MKRYNTLIPAFCGLVLLASCNKDNKVITDQQTADLVESSLATVDAGAMEDYKMAATYAEVMYSTYVGDCSFTDDTIYSFNYTGPLRTYDFSSAMSWTVDCTGLEVTAITFALVKSGSYAGPKCTRDGDATGTLVLTDLAPSFAEYSASGTLNGNGNATFETSKGTVTTSTVTELTLTSLTIDKSTYQITSGSGALTIDATKDGKSVTKTATLTFDGSSVIFTINGEDYVFTIY